MNNNLTPFEYSIYRDEIIKTVILFVFQSFKDWKVNPDRTLDKREKVLTNDLVKYISRSARHEGQNFSFIPEEPQVDAYTVDIAAFPMDKEDDYTKNIIVFECKRLPAPEKHREYEYVSGKLGGIARFKLEKHGANHKVVGMIGYVQDGIIDDHLKKINNYIIELKKIINNEDDLFWGKDVKIKTIEYINDDGLFHGHSKHQRLTLDPVFIHHLWIVL